MQETFISGLHNQNATAELSSPKWSSHSLYLGSQQPYDPPRGGGGGGGGGEQQSAVQAAPLTAALSAEIITMG